MSRKSIQVTVPDEEDEIEEEEEEEEEAPTAPPPIYRGTRRPKLMEERADLYQLVKRCLANTRAISENTMETYVTRLGVVRSRYHDHHRLPRPAKNDHSWMTKADRVLDFVVHSWPNHETQKITVESLIAVTSRLEGDAYDKAAEIYRAQQSKLASLSDNRYITQGMSEKEKERWCSWEEILDKATKFRSSHWPRLASRSTFSEDDWRLFQELMCLAVYTALPPLRLEWGTVKIKRFNPTVENYVDFPRKRVVFHVFKTAKFYNSENILDIEDPVLMQMFQKARQMSGDCEFLFQNCLGKPYVNSSAFGAFVSKTFERVTGKKLGASMLRKSFVSYAQAKANVPLTREILALQTLSRQMGHSFDQQSKYRRVDEGSSSLATQIREVENLRKVAPGHTRDVLTTAPMNADRLSKITSK